jgi:putative Mg2+ transporter-C (MgtC) family protein
LHRRAANQPEIARRGFIGAGAIVRRDRLVTGVTTAAITVIGLIIGAGYIALGLGLAAIAFVVLFVFKRDEPLLYREHRAE